MKQEIINGIEQILSKYYFLFNTEETREAIANEVKFYLRTKSVDSEISYKEVGIDANRSTLTVTLEK